MVKKETSIFALNEPNTSIAFHPCCLVSKLSLSPPSTCHLGWDEYMTPLILDNNHREPLNPRRTEQFASKEKRKKQRQDKIIPYYLCTIILGSQIKTIPWERVLSHIRSFSLKVEECEHLLS